MAALNIRNLPEDVHRRLRVRAARNGRSMEAEARLILEQAVRDEAALVRADGSALQERVAELYGRRLPAGVVDELLAERRQEAEREAREGP